jgi:predicted phosphoribosyltransferase
MKPKFITEKSLKDRIHVFKDRADAGRQLGRKLRSYKNTDTIVLGIPSGGVPVASEIAKLLNLNIDLVLVRKIQIPWNTEAGFGAANLDGEVIMSEELLKSLGLSRDETKEQVQKTRDILEKRNRLFRGGIPFPEIKNRAVILVDDGLASGYTMLAALNYLHKRAPEKIIVAVPTGSQRTVDLILNNTDELVCLNIRTGFSFAVADAYINWYDLTDEEVQSLLGTI